MCHSNVTVIILGKSQIYRRFESGRDLWISPNWNHLLKPGSDRSGCSGLWISPKMKVFATTPGNLLRCLIILTLGKTTKQTTWLKFSDFQFVLRIFGPVTEHHFSTFKNCPCSPAFVDVDEIPASFSFAGWPIPAALATPHMLCTLSPLATHPLLDWLQSVHVFRAGNPRLDPALQVFLCSTEQGRRITYLDLLAACPEAAQKSPHAADFQVTGGIHTGIECSIMIFGSHLLNVIY